MGKKSLSEEMEADDFDAIAEFERLKTEVRKLEAKLATYKAICQRTCDAIPDKYHDASRSIPTSVEKVVRLLAEAEAEIVGHKLTNDSLSNVISAHEKSHGPEHCVSTAKHTDALLHIKQYHENVGVLEKKAEALDDLRARADRVVTDLRERLDDIEGGDYQDANTYTIFEETIKHLTDTGGDTVPVIRQPGVCGGQPFGKKDTEPITQDNVKDKLIEAIKDSGVKVTFDPGRDDTKPSAPILTPDEVATAHGIGCTAEPEKVCSRCGDNKLGIWLCPKCREEPDTAPSALAKGCEVCGGGEAQSKCPYCGGPDGKGYDGEEMDTADEPSAPCPHHNTITRRDSDHGDSTLCADCGEIISQGPDTANTPSPDEKGGDR